MKSARIILCLVTVTLLFGSCSDQTRSTSLPVDYPTTITLADTGAVIAYRPLMNLVFMPGAINGQDSCWFILDTGSPYSLLNADRLEHRSVRLGLSRPETMSGRHVTVRPAYNVAITIGDISLTADSLRALPLAALEPIAGHRIDGIIGHDLFERFVVALDYQANTVTVQPADEFSYRGNGTEFEISIENGDPFVITEVMHPDDSWRPAKLGLDTRSSDFIGFNGSYVRNENLFPESWPRLPALGTAVGGHTNDWETRLYDFRLGEFRFSSPIVGYSENTLGGGHAGIIGAEFLRRFNVTFDFPHRRMFLEPTERYYDEFRYDLSGIFPIAEPPDFATKKVRAVRPGSMAEKEGIQAGDILARVDSYTGPHISISDIRRLFAKPGKVTLMIRRGKAVRKVVLRLKQSI